MSAWLPAGKWALARGSGCRKQTWVRTFTLDAPTRVVIDVGR
ncbi:MAG: hypothetical protein ACRDQY_03790 [Pseudonocardiaceae bacterium]